MTISVTADNAAHFIRELNTLGFIRAIDAVPAPMAELRTCAGHKAEPFAAPEVLTSATVTINDPAQGVQPTTVAVTEQEMPAAQETTEQKRKRRGKAEMEAARVFEKYVADHGEDEGKVLLAEYGIGDVADIGPERAEHFVGRAKCGPNLAPEESSYPQPKDLDTSEDLLGDIAEEPTAPEAPVAEPWLLKGPDGNRYDAYATPEEWCESLAALIASADTAAEIKALATVNAGIQARMEAAGKIDLLRGVVDGGRTRMAELESKPADGAPTVQDCAAALRAYLDPNRTSKLTSDERTSKASEILKVKFGAPKVASLKPEQFVAFIAALAEAGAE